MLNASFCPQIMNLLYCKEMKPLASNKPQILLVVGQPAAGKTFFAKQFSDTFKTIHVDYEHYHELLSSVELGDKAVTEFLKELFKTKQTIIVEGRGESRHDRFLLANLARSKGYDLLIIWVQTDPQTIRQRVGRTGTYTAASYEAKLAAFEPPDRTEQVLVISGRHTFSGQAKMVLKRIVTQRSASPLTMPPDRTSGNGTSGRITVN